MSLNLPTAAPAPRAFLGVARSATGRFWRERLDLRGAQATLAIVQRTGVPEILARVLAGRGVGIDEVEAWLDPTVKRLLPDPDTLTDMGPCVARLADAVTTGEKVAVFGDYDVDGATSTALLVEVLRAGGLDPAFYIPDRIFEGYGPNIPAIEGLAAGGASLLVPVDCGTMSFEPFARARELGLDVVVIDHHQAGETLPEVAALVNPNRVDDLSGLGHLCAVGLVFVVAVGLLRELEQRGWWNAARPKPNLLADLDLVALGTVADVVPLLGLNRAYVTKGLLQLRKRERPGLTALMDAARLSGPPKAWHLGFLLGPRINAGGRIGDAALGTRLLLTRDPIEAAAIAAELDRLNAERQQVERAIVAQAEAEAEAALGRAGEGAVILSSGQGWHPGVVGLVAARLKEKFGRPAFAIAFTGESGAGSARSIPGVDVGRAVRAAVELGILVKGGGHAMAAGLTVAREKLGELRAHLEEVLAVSVEEARAVDETVIDGALSAAGATPDLVELIEKAGPFGAGNPQPIFAFPAHRIVYAEPGNSDQVRVRLRGSDGTVLSGVAFRAANTPLGQALIAARGQQAHVAGMLELDSWQGRTQVNLRICDVAMPEIG
ncbi:single-stranded-DNA-specific exonuclease RecJ [Ancylobacter novellus DSM 506]|uniref:Single-stranded-DNA-specific exonuclease RecJ n=1 Tax=Ancylobacter novellus (strain ATCC 8093 / DSM 506 / JCM 20403 / CCM 1077 / IAM 12100 / NBRC 12443 / NCIMB 10456) TaxID=639283 RepID=D7A8X8_ANCN5|nr:single-stranded-DNA-specific exonuclease RecJ [Ancylobacter novellus]ADH88683.1 single-stranded-DNA-specific exonuclease RecJ [Ancylobacter novellus DSM 506]